MRRLALVPAMVALMAATDLPQSAPVPTDNPQASNDAAAETDQVDGAGATTSETGADDIDTSADEEPAASEPAPSGTESVSDDGTDDEEQEDASELPNPAAAPDQAPEAIDEAVLAQCEAELRSLGAVFQRRETIDGDGACGVYQPYNLREAAPGVIVKPDTEMTCPAALATARWVRDEVLPATRALGENVELSEVIHASTYVCRNRNNQPDAKISEHSRGSAIDITSFDFDGHDPIPVVPRAGKGTIEEAFQRSVRAGACMHFTTVLGPGSDDYHDDHLHFDLAERSSGYRLCQ